MWFWKRNKKEQPVIIKTDCYNKLPKEHKAQFAKTSGIVQHTHTVVEDDGNFALSMAVGMATDNIALGYMAGESLSGALVGEMMAESSHENHDFGGFDGGSGGGGGAGGDWGGSSDNSSSSDSGSSSSDSSSSYDSSSSSDSSSYSDSSSSDSGSSDSSF